MKNTKLEKIRAGYFRFATGVSHVMMWIAIAIFIVMIFSVTYGVIGRYISFVRAPRWTQELATLCMVWLCFISAGYAIGVGAHVRMTLLNKVFGEKVSSILHYLAHVLLFGVNVFFIVYGIKLSIMMSTSKMSATGWPIWLNYLALVVGGIYGAVMALAKIAKGDL